MTRFSLMGEEEEEDDDLGFGPSSSSSSPRPKKQPRLLLTRKRRIFCDELDEEEDEQLLLDQPQQQQQQQQQQQSSQDHHQEEEVEDEEDDDGEDEDDEEEEEEEEEEYRGGGGGGQTSNDVVKVSDRHSTTTRAKVDGSISVTLTDPDVLDCPICLEPLTIPVFQCENGHVACSCCCSKLRNKCPSCSFPIGYNRCRAIEKVLESVKVPCRYTKYSCKETVTYSKIHDHEKMCIHSPCTCPLPGCVFTASSERLYRHVRIRHANSTTPFSFDSALVISLEMNEKYLILQEKDEGVIFTLNHDVDRLGSVVNVNCIGPSSWKRGFSYDLIARNGGSSVKSQYSIESVSSWCPRTPRKAFLLVPNDIVGSRQRIELQLRIWKEDGYVLLGN